MRYYTFTYPACGHTVRGSNKARTLARPCNDCAVEALEQETEENTLDIRDEDIRLDHIPDVAECRQLRRQMKADNFFPDVYHVNDHGNVDLLAIGYNGAKIIRSWV